MMCNDKSYIARHKYLIMTYIEPNTNTYERLKRRLRFSRDKKINEEMAEQYAKYKSTAENQELDDNDDTKPSDPVEDVVHSVNELSSVVIADLDIFDRIKLESALKKFQRRMRNHRLSQIDEDEYESWTVAEMVYWISTLESGRFIKYIDHLRNGFLEDRYNGEYLPNIKIEHLRNEPFNILNIKDRTDLVNHFVGLRTNLKSAKDAKWRRDLEHIFDATVVYMNDRKVSITMHMITIIGIIIGIKLFAPEILQKIKKEDEEEEEEDEEGEDEDTQEEDDEEEEEEEEEQEED